MKILLVGSGGREHALAWKLSQSPQIDKVYCAPGNAGTAEVAENLPVGSEEIGVLCSIAQQAQIDLTVVGPELPLVAGIVDLFEDKNLKIFGPRKQAAMLEGSKVFAKEFMRRHGIPTADFRVFDEPGAARDFIEKKGAPLVVKADGLAGGKGVFVCTTVAHGLAAVENLMEKKILGPAGEKILVEDFLPGEEASFLAFCDGERVLPLPASQDHKPLLDGDRGPNTGGMGAYSPAPVVTPELSRAVIDTVMIPTVKAMAKEGNPYQGVLYAGLMISKGKASVLEFNVRFGDPEAQPLLCRLETDLVPIFEACCSGSLERIQPQWNSQAAVCVVMASRGYPDRYEKGKVIRGVPDAAAIPGVTVFHAGTARRDGTLVTNGGRVLGVTGLGPDVASAIATTYRAVKKISWDGMHFRTDIGAKALLKSPGAGRAAPGSG
ncbi:MAG: phosphoribosylamine--glycine ligase [Candidatus Tectomicrobia bacterium]|uniref:Phosphoribosylamine--glycine ligase n=1 Tax=Tectimicrobiota bacterium TaxID=2528274 RepID=A0A932GQ85_UNCTE|nr:phosphoribosylamine--glycine ligase [Candidatus Tectomicrobia bacterium]